MYIIPGYGESHKKQSGYKDIAKMCTERGIKPIHVSIDWHAKGRKHFEKYISQFLRQYKKPKDAKIYVLGFSYGAMIAFLSEPITRPDALILCSLSPYFKEDLKTLKPSWLTWWNANFKDSDYSFNKLAPKIKTRTFLIAGDNEGPELARRVRLAKRMIRNSSRVTVKGAKHNVSRKKYLSAVGNIIEKL